MIEFYLVAAGLIVAAALFVIFPFMLRYGDSTVSTNSEVSGRRKMNIAAFKERQLELQNELEQGLVDQQEFDQLATELQRRLLDETAEMEGPDVESQPFTRPPVLVPVLLVAVIAVLTAVVYQYTGYKSDWEITQTLEVAREKVAAGEDATSDRLRLLAQLEKRLQRGTDEPFYLMLKGNIEMEMGRLDDSVVTFNELMGLAPDDAMVMSQALQVRFLRNQRRLTPADVSLANRILELDPNNARTLGLLGINSFEGGQYAEAIEYWQRLLPLIGPFSPNGKMISQGIEQAKRLLVAAGGELEQGESTNQRLEVEVALSESIQAEPDASVFVYARAFNGSRMPLAVKRLTVAELPARIVLDDSMAMAPGMNLSSVETVEVIARISKNGIANRGSGDAEGVLGPVTVADTNTPVAVLIDQVLP